MHMSQLSIDFDSSHMWNASCWQIKSCK